MLIGVRPASVRSYEADWGKALPRRVRAELGDGTRLDASVDEAEQDVDLPPAAFEPPPCAGCRAIDADEARRLLGRTLMARNLRLRSFAKINLGLEVLGVREDGYHELRTLFQTIDLADEIVLRPARRGVSVACDHPLVPKDATNLAARAAELLRGYAQGRRRESRSEIKKRIPVGGGLGGGSSNAAAVLLGLDRLWKLGLGPDGLHRLAARLGADVPYFLLGGTALGLARGDEVYPLRRQIRGHVVLVDPGIHVSTARVFAPAGRPD